MSCGKKSRLTKVKRSNYLLLEVMIAFTIVVLCALPLIAPHSWMIKEESELLQYIENDRYINLIYSHIVEQLYGNEISWNTLISPEASIKIDTSQIQGIPQDWPYGTILTTGVINQKKGNDESQRFYFFSLMISLTYRDELIGKPYRYNIFLERQTKIGQDKPLDEKVEAPDEGDEFEEEPEEESEEE